MARTKKQEPAKETATVVTRAEKKDATKNLIKECLAVKPLKHNELLDEVAKLYKDRFGGEETENINDVKGRIGSVLDIMKKDSDVAYEGGMYALKARVMPEPVEVAEKKEKPAKKTTKKAVKEKAEPAVEEVKVEEKPAKKTAKKAKSTKKTEPLPPAPMEPIAPVAPVTPEVAPEPIPAEKEEKPAPKKRGRKAKAVETPAVEVEKAETASVVEEKVEMPAVEPEKVEEKPETSLVVKEKAPIAKKEVIDVSFFLGSGKPAKAPAKAEPVKEEKQPEKVEEKEKTQTFVHALDEENKLKEIVRLLGGEDNDEFAVKHAEELIKQAKEYKKSII